MFVLSPEGQRIVFPPDPQEEGNNLARETDIAGKPYGRMFQDTPRGVELVNPGIPELEGRNLINLRDASGQLMVRRSIALVLLQGLGWTTYWWPQPDASRLPLRKLAHVREVVTPQGETLIVGSGM